MTQKFDTDLQAVYRLLNANDVHFYIDVLAQFSVEQVADAIRAVEAKVDYS